jgi:small subunit ribosomal protein S1
MTTENLGEVSTNVEEVSTNVEEISMKDMMGNIDQSMARISSGDVVRGTVISVNENEVLVNIGYMADGVIAKEEISNEKDVNPVDVVKTGDEIFVYIMKVKDEEGNVALSKKRADSIKVWDDLQTILDENKAFEVTVNEIVKGGATAYIHGVRAFIPASQMSNAYVENLQDFKGKTLEVKIIELDKESKRVVLSRKVIEKEAAEVKATAVWNELKKGEKRKGVVSRLAKFGAFVNLGGVDGLIHVSDLSWKRVTDPSEVVSVGDEVEVFVLDFDKAKGRISLGLKEAKGNPWNNITSLFHTNDIVEGKVVRLMDFGAFVQLSSGIEGLVHLSEISEDRIAKVSDVLTVGDVVKVKIGEINEKDKRISLSIKEAADKSYGDLSEYNGNEQGMTLGDLLKDKFKDFKFE